MPLRPLNREQSWLFPQPWMSCYLKTTRPALWPSSWTGWTVLNGPKWRSTRTETPGSSGLPPPCPSERVALRSPASRCGRCSRLYLRRCGRRYFRHVCDIYRSTLMARTESRLSGGCKCQSSCLRRGSKASRIQSPRKLKPMTVRKIAIPGKKAIPQVLAR